MAEAVKVIVRCRPMNSREKSLNCKEVVVLDNKTGQCSIQNPADKRTAPPKNFTFDGAYGIDSTTEQIYADIGYPLVEGVTEGYNGTIFAYGQTGCGKSFSMQGIQEPATQRGIIPRAFEHVFETINCSEGTKYLVHASYLEIYNENIRDLLGKDFQTKLELKEHPDKGVYTQGLSMWPCKSVAECDKVMAHGWKNRSTGATLMNAESSRSHSIFTIYMERCDKDETGEEHIRAAKLNLVDLAGSERQAKTGATGDRLKEATKINLSLSALGNVISALVDAKSKHIPYRDSKLTRLLQDSLGGNTKTLMVACLSPADNNYDETLSTLRYANRAKNIKNKPKINEDPKDALLREYQEEINKLRAMLRGEIPVDIGGDGSEKLRALSGLFNMQNQKIGALLGLMRKSKMDHMVAAAAAAAGGSVVEKVVTVTDDQAIEKEKVRLKEEYEHEMVSMRSEFEEMKISKEKLEEEMEKLKTHYDTEIASVNATGHVTGVKSPGQQTDTPRPMKKRSGGSNSKFKPHTLTLESVTPSPRDTPVGTPRPSPRASRDKIIGSPALSVDSPNHSAGRSRRGRQNDNEQAQVAVIAPIPTPRKTTSDQQQQESSPNEQQQQPLDPSAPPLSVEDGVIPITSAPVQIPVRTQEGEVLYMSAEEVEQGLPPGAELLALDEKSQELVPMTLPVQKADGQVVQMSQKEIEEQGLPEGAEVMSVKGMKETPSPKILVIPEKVPVKTVSGEIVYMTQMELGDGLPPGSQVMKEENGELVPQETVSIKTIEGTIESITQEEVAEGLPIGAEVVTTQDKSQAMVSEEESKEKVIVRTSEGSLLTVSKEEIEQGLPPGMEVVSVSHGNDVAAELQEEDHEDPNYIQKQVIQHAVHLATVKTINDEGTPGTPTTPSASPTGEHTSATINGQAFQQEEALRRLPNSPEDIPRQAKNRLEMLQQQMVGGEQVNNIELKEKRRKKKKHVEERKRKLAEALAQMEGEEIMLDIYDNIQDELKANQKLLKREKDKNETLERDVKDLEAEFEFDRIDYLDTIRKQEQTVKWLESVIEKIHPCLRRDCNYVNLDKIKALSEWDDEKNKWILPKMTIDKTKLPTPSGIVLPGASQEQKTVRNGDVYHDLQSEDRYYQKLSQKSDDEAMGYFKSNRQEQILNQRNKQVNGSLSNGKIMPTGMMNGNHRGMANGPGPAPWQSDPMSQDQMKAAQVHGQLSAEDAPVRKPSRLDALPPPTTAGGRRKNKKKIMNTMEQY